MRRHLFGMYTTNWAIRLPRWTRYTYDKLSRRLTRKLPGGETEYYFYDAGGNLTNRTDFKGKATTFAYDVLNRLTQKTPDASLGEPSVSFTYTSTGQRATMTDASGSTAYYYNEREWLTNKTVSIVGHSMALHYSYDAAGNLLTTRSSNTDGVNVTNSYDALGRLGTVASYQAGETDYTYDSVGNLASVMYANGVGSYYAYDNLNRLTNLYASQGFTAKANYRYTLDTSGNRTNMYELLGRTVTWQYDSLYRLTREVIQGGGQSSSYDYQNGTNSYAYDAVGNRTNFTTSVPALSSQTVTFSANDWISSFNGGAGDTNDANGNTIGGRLASGGYAVDKYDFENHLTNRNSGTVLIKYDGDGNRVRKTVGGVHTYYLVDDRNPTGYAQVLEELTATGTDAPTVSRVYTYGHDLIAQDQYVEIGYEEWGWQLCYFGYDGHGSVRYLSDISGNITDRYEYDAYGTQLIFPGYTQNNYLYTGEQYDPDLGMYYLRARYSNPTTGRFWTMDSYEGQRPDPHSLHKYLYCRDNPANRVDPSGHNDFSLTGVMVNVAMRVGLGAAIGGVARGADAMIDGRPIWEETVAGAKWGAAVGFTSSFKLLRPVLALAGAALGGYSTGDAISEEKYGLATYRGFLTAAGIAGYWYFSSPKGSISVTKGLTGSKGTIYFGGYDPKTGGLHLGDDGHFGGMQGAGGTPSPSTTPGITVLETAKGVQWANDSLSLPKALSASGSAAVQSLLEGFFNGKSVQQVPVIK